MTGISDKSKEILKYRAKHKHWPMKAVAKHFGVKKQWVYILCNREGTQSAAEPYVGMVLHIRNVPEDIVESVKVRANEEGLTMRLKIIELLENYGKGLDK